MKDFLSLATLEILSKFFLPSLEPKLEYFLSLMDSIYNLAQFFCLFFEPKLEELKLFEVGCPDLSLVSVLHTSWLKQWSKAKDFLQTFFLEKYFYCPYQRKNLS